MDEYREIIKKSSLLSGSQCEEFDVEPRRPKIRRLAETPYDEETIASHRRMLKTFQVVLIFFVGIPAILSCIAVYFDAPEYNYIQMILREFSYKYNQHYNHIVYGKNSYCDRHQPLNTENLFKLLKQEYRILHQDEALKHLRVSLTNDSDVNAISIIGPVGVGKSLIVNAIAEHFPWPRNVHSYSWNTAVRYEVEKFRVVRLMINHLSKCGRNLIIIENLETCDHGIVPIINDLIQKINKTVLIIYVFSLNTELDKDILDEQQFFLKWHLAETNVIELNTFSRETVKDCIRREAALEGVTLTPEDFNEILDTNNPYRFGCKNINAKVRLYGTIKNVS